MSLQKYRVALGFTQKDVADRVGISSNRYAQIERGEVALPSMPVFSGTRTRNCHSNCHRKSRIPRFYAG